MSDRIRTFADFWLFYLGEHARPTTRALHLVGSTAGLVCGALAVALRSPALAAAGLLAGYGFAWIGHFFIEHNRPATFRYPLWSFLADWKMWGCALSGRLGRELRRAGLR
ncbi:MAG TPA: DUF962 domain-containing protein [Polyangia bacterium]|nr:DUF962 domain-containing protein [Polyangia bacterium]